ncbi:conserved membrane protein, unknown function [Hepatocystis sp. ex Piliocolobus tephrosceles]|nr:conserved membrane protein, unknown function [Hepatocystis sp. ex Piliocolobus tephrosceles]
MNRLGYKRDCCCGLSVAGANILIALFYFISIIPDVIYDGTFLIPILDFICGILLISGVIFKSYRIFIIVIFTQTLWMIIDLYLIIFLTVTLTCNEVDPHSDIVHASNASIIATSLTLSILLILISVYFLNIYISMVRILQAGGSGWEHKNFEEIKQDQLEMDIYKQEIENGKQYMYNKKRTTKEKDEITVLDTIDSVNDQMA